MEKLYSSIFMIVLTFIIIYFISKKYDLDRNQKLIFWLFVLFWSGITVVRAYRKLYAISPMEEGAWFFDCFGCTDNFSIRTNKLLYQTANFYTE